MGMKIICAVKFVPDVDRIAMEAETTTADLNPVGSCPRPRMILNPDDACALAFALQVKAGTPGCSVEVVSAGPRVIRPHMEDLLRLSVDRATLIEDPGSAGSSDSGAVAHLLAWVIAGRPYDCILTGTHSLDGGSASVPGFLAEILGLDQMLGIVRIDPDGLDKGSAVIEVADDQGISTYEIGMPSVLGMARESGYKLPYLKLTDMRREVFHNLTFISADDLGVFYGQEGGARPFQRVVNTYPNTYHKKEHQIVKNDEAGIGHVFDFLKVRGLV